ncbi:MAG: prolyl oligopeptidase family protein, partial [Myxococcota bacterium]
VEGGFYLPEAKGNTSWIDQDHIYVMTDFGEGTLTESGYPRVTKRWTRGTKLEEAEIVFEGESTDISVGAYHDNTPGWERDLVYRGLTFYSNELYLVTDDGLEKIDKPDSAKADLWKEWLLIELRDDWDVGGNTYKAGSLLAANFKKWRKGKRKVQVLFEPTERTSLSGYSNTQDHLLLSTLDNVQDRIEVLTPGKKAWTREDLKLTEGAMMRQSAWAVDAKNSNRIFMNVSGYTTPSTLIISDLSADEAAPTELAKLPALYNAEGLQVSQHMATSKDGTKIPYFQVSQEGMALDGSNPTLLYGYGGFEVSLRPGYSAGVGSSWLEKGGVYVVANIRGGGEFGPTWHQAALKEKRHRAYEDFAAVGEDLVSRKVTSVPKLGILGGSNGGLLMGNMLTLYPDHWGAIVCKVPLLDMQRYHKLLAGASWMGEYGDPDVPEEWSYIKTFSPYHTVDVAKVDYPPILFTTSTRDDRVHPGHARKMAAKMRAGDENGVLYYENIEGGHGGAADNGQRAFMDALSYTFLWKVLSGEAVEPVPQVKADEAAPE